MDYDSELVSTCRFAQTDINKKIARAQKADSFGSFMSPTLYSMLIIGIRRGSKRQVLILMGQEEEVPVDPESNTLLKMHQSNSYIFILNGAAEI